MPAIQAANATIGAPVGNPFAANEFWYELGDSACNLAISRLRAIEPLQRVDSTPPPRSVIPPLIVSLVNAFRPRGGFAPRAPPEYFDQRNYPTLDLPHGLSDVHECRAEPSWVYILSPAPTLFGEWTLLGEWSRVGSAGTVRTTTFERRSDAEKTEQRSIAANALRVCRARRIAQVPR
jgi:hypothetical protein